MGHIQAVGYYSVIKKNETMSAETTLLEPQNILVSGASQALERHVPHGLPRMWHIERLVSWKLVRKGGFLSLGVDVWEGGRVRRGTEQWRKKFQPVLIQRMSCVLQKAWGSLNVLS